MLLHVHFGESLGSKVFPYNPLIFTPTTTKINVMLLSIALASNVNEAIAFYSILYYDFSMLCIFQCALLWCH